MCLVRRNLGSLASAMNLCLTASIRKGVAQFGYPSPPSSPQDQTASRLAAPALM